MRDIDLIPIRLHKGEPTWEIIDELLEMIDSSPSEEEIEVRVQDARDDGYHDGSEAGYDDGYEDGRSDGYGDGFMEGKESADD